MYLIAGLGNIGRKYAYTRHNLGFMVVDNLLQPNLENRLKVIEVGETDEYVIKKMSDGENEFLVMKALGFMNLSGRPIATVMTKNNINPTELIVVHDDIDLEEGAMRVKLGGGSGGHNGLRSITDEIGSNEFIRVRMGVGRPPGKKRASTFVLEEYTQKELHEAAFLIMDAIDAVNSIIRDGVQEAMNKTNGRES